MASPFALNFHSGVEKLMKSHLNFYLFAVSKKLGKVSCFIEQNSDRKSNWNSDKIPTGKIEAYPLFQLFWSNFCQKSRWEQYSWGIFENSVRSPKEISKPSGLSTRNSWRILGENDSDYSFISKKKILWKSNHSQ